MSTVERVRARARRRSAAVLRVAGEELRAARLLAGVSQEDVGRAVGISKAEVSRIERCLAPWVALDVLCRIAVALGLDPSLRMFPAGPPLRDRAHLALLERLRAELPRSIRWQVEVPLPIPGDPRAWDASVSSARWRIGVEAETKLHDLQALERRIGLKQRDAGGIPVIILINDTRGNRTVLATARESLRSLAPLDTRAVLTALRAGQPPRDSGIVVL